MSAQLTQLEFERARVRDLLKYYRPNLRQFRPAHYEECASPGDEAAEPLNGCHIAEGEPSESIPSDSQLLSHDPTLTAFAQLATFRLDCSRTFISLMDHNHQYLLAEATKSVSLMSRKICDRGDGVYLGARVMDLKWGVCPNTIQVFTAKDSGVNIESEEVTANQECYVMNDLAAIEKFKDRPYVAGWPYMRFYAEVPIHSPTGHVIGTLCVADNKPRQGLGEKGLAALKEISSAIMKHLALVQGQHDLQRAGAMVKGLGRFVQERSNSLTDAGQRLGILGGNLPSEASTPQTASSRTSSSASDTQASSLISTEPTSVTTATTKGQDQTIEAAEPNNHQKTGPPPTTSQVDTKSGLSRIRELQLNDPRSFQAVNTSIVNKQLFLRASNLVRIALDMDGVVFLDACFRDVAIDPENPVLLPQASPMEYRGIPGESEDVKSSWLDDAGPNNDGSFGPEVAIPRPDRLTSSTSDVIAHSTKSPSNARGLLSSGTQAPLSQVTLRRLVQNYPQGHAFIFNEDGSLERGHDVQGCSPEKPVHEPTTSCISQLLALCPDARSIIFLPLWDPKRTQWFSGGLAWTKDPTRIIEATDISYLEAFGSCIMSEKARLDAITADRAKSNFLSSVSHELRSPLHGILASAEALQESEITPSQEDMIQTVMGCGEVLLDTVDQILDFAKESHSKPGSTLPVVDSKQMDMDKTLPLAFANLLENTVEAMVAGYDYRRTDFTSLNSGFQDKRNTTELKLPSHDVMVIVSIDRQIPGIWRSQSSSWKRIIMNLCGNSLKYTQSGFIHISLGVQMSRPSLTKPAEKHIIFQVSDSGKGISKDYLRYQLFTPFSQEDQLAGGTGLGLSIVRQLVDKFGGGIDVQSEVGYGTTVKVSVPAGNFSLTNTELEQDSSSVTELRSRCSGLSMCLIGFEYYPDIGDEPTGILSAYARCVLVLKSALTQLATDWFGMKVTTISSPRDAKADIMVGLRSKGDLLKNHIGNRPLILINDDLEDKNSDSDGVFSLSQIVSPQKLARVLALCLDYNPAAHQPSRVENLPIHSTKSRPEEASKPLNAKPPVTSPQIIAETKTLETKDLPDSSIIPKDTNENKASEISSTNKNTQISGSPQETIPARPKVLLVEDNIVNMKVLVNYMKKANQEYETAMNGLEALQIFQAEPLAFKIVFMDISMPVMDGLTSCLRMREHEAKHSLQRAHIVALTCFSSPEYQEGAAISGFDKFLIKPVSMKLLKPILELQTETPSGGS